MTSPARSDKNLSPRQFPCVSEYREDARERQDETIVFDEDPSPQEIANYTVMGGNLLAIDNYARKWSRHGEDFVSYEAILDRVFSYYRHFLSQRNRDRFVEQEPDLGDDGSSSRRSPTPPPRPKRQRNSEPRRISLPRRCKPSS